MDCGYELVVAFDTDSEMFARGAEVGMLLVRLQVEPKPVRAIAHTRNTEMLFRLAEATGTRVQAHELGADWLEVTFS
jgi:hypothetical protein